MAAEDQAVRLWEAGGRRRALASKRRRQSVKCCSGLLFTCMGLTSEAVISSVCACNSLAVQCPQAADL